jgi:hypothetical protein
LNEFTNKKRIYVERRRLLWLKNFQGKNVAEVCFPAEEAKVRSDGFSGK